MLAERILKGDVRAASRLMRDIDDGLPSATDELKALFPKTGRARIIGITGSPGAGKSTLTDRLIGAYRRQGKKVGVLAVDPTSPFSGGAILGDRIRMQGHATDDGVFIRSLATRGHLGGLSRATSDCIRVMDAMGMDVVLVETVGVGQDELDIAQLAHTTIVVVVPGMGDDIQAIKAGIFEVADLFAVNKADREGADRTVRELTAMLELRHVLGQDQPDAETVKHHGAAAATRVSGQGRPLPPAAAVSGGEWWWTPPIVKTVATKDEGVDELVKAVARHHAELEKSGRLFQREVNRARAEFTTILRERLMKAALQRVGTLDTVAERIARREQDPYGITEELASRLSGEANGGSGK